MRSHLVNAVMAILLLEPVTQAQAANQSDIELACQIDAGHYHEAAEERDAGRSREDLQTDLLESYNDSVKNLSGDAQDLVGDRESITREISIRLDAVYGHPEWTPSSIHERRYQACITKLGPLADQI